MSFFPALFDVQEVENENLKNPAVVADLNRSGELDDGRRQEGRTYSGDVVTGRVLLPRCCTVHEGKNKRGRGPFLVDAAWPVRMKVELDQSGIDEGCAALLHGFVLATRPEVVFETGTHKARSAHAMVSALVLNEAGHLTTVDMDDYGIWDAVFDEHHKPYVTQVVGKSPEVLGSPALEHVQSIDMAFLDGAHDGDTLLKEIDWVESRRAYSCCVFIDNAADMGWKEVREVLNGYNKYARMLLPTMAGTELIWMYGEAQS